MNAVILSKNGVLKSKMQVAKSNQNDRLHTLCEYAYLAMDTSLNQYRYIYRYICFVLNYI